MSPWEENTYFDFPTVTVASPGTWPTWSQLVGANPQRVALIFSCTQGGPAVISPNQDKLNLSGIVINTSQNPFVILQKELGILAQVAWFGVSLGAASITITELIMREWPAEMEPIKKEGE